MGVLVIIPAYNEAENLGKVVQDLRDNLPGVDILVVNDCSQDATEQVALTLGVRCVSHPFNMGYAAALQTGFKFAAEYAYDYIIQFDGDGQHLATEAGRLLAVALEKQADVVIGSRFMADTGYRNSFFRSIGTRFFSALVKWLGHQKIYDPTSGLIVLSREYYNLFARMNNYPEYPDANLLIELIRAGANVQEIPVTMKLRTAGQSMHSGIAKPIIYMVLMCYSILIVLLRRSKR